MSSPRTERRGGGCLRIVGFGAVLLVVLAVVGAVFGERFARSEVERGVSSSLTQSLGGTTSVHVDDRWVLPGLVRNSFGSISGSAPTATFSQTTAQGEQTLRVTDLAFSAKGVTDLRGSGPIHVDFLTGSGVVSYAELSRLAGTEISSAGGDRVKLHETASVWGAQVSIDVTARPLVTGGKLVLDDPQATLSGISVPQSLLRPVVNRITDRVELPTIEGLDDASLVAGRDGVRVELTGSNLDLPR